AALRVPKNGSQSRGGSQTRFAQTCALLIPCLTTVFGSCFNAEQVNCHCHFNTNTNTNTKGPAPVRFSCGHKPRSVATRVSVFFAGFIAKITLTLLADSECLPSNFRVAVVWMGAVPP
ncbi:hypothetical protein, partial [Actimicrobium sp. CCI2.3]|uniref:hypothetical protein n=1 Tax=Actimicrobium sp. CCI2.3 TaxID=3048616 RepID=UPI002B24410E